MAVVTDLDKLNQEVTEMMLRHYGDRLAKIILYGSYARGDFNEESDVDYLVLLNEENVSAIKEVATTAADRNAYYLKTFIHISAIVASYHQFLTSDRLFYREARREGKQIYERRPKSLPQEGERLFGKCQNHSQPPNFLMEPSHQAIIAFSGLYGACSLKKTLLPKGTLLPERCFHFIS